MKKYKCIGLREKAAKAWANMFIVGEVYKEAPGRLAKAMLSEDTLFLFDKAENPIITFFVDKDQFEECTK